MEDLLKEHEKLIHSVISRLDFVPDKVDKQDLYQVGYIALWEALKCYDEAYGFEISTHCYNRIKAKVIDYLREQQAIKRKEVLKSDYDDSFEQEVNLKMLLYEIEKTLPRDIYNIFVDKYLYKYTINDLMNKYNLTKSQVETRLRQAKLKVINKLKDYRMEENI